MIKKAFFWFCVAILPLLAKAQSSSINNQYWLQMPLLNPAASGVFNDVEIATGSQIGPNWDDIDTRNPEIYVRGDVFFEKINSAFGLNYTVNNANKLFSKTPDFINNQHFGINYNYQFQLKNNDVLAFGASFNVEQADWNINWIPTNPGPDPVEMPESGTNSAYNFGSGVFYKSNIWFAGFSINPTIKLKEAEYFVYDEMNYTVVTGAEIPMGKKFQLYSTLLAASNLSTATTIDLMMQIKYNKTVYVGGALSTGNAVLPDNWQAIAGVVIAKKYLVHYGFGQPISDLNSSKSFIHNFSIVYSFSR